MTMRVLAGLGNPGAQYAGNRHNIGFMALDRIAHAHGGVAFRPKHGGEMAEIRLGSDKLILFKPQSYMNRSGQPIGALLRWLKLGPEALVVFHDELDLAPGKLRIKRGGGHAGHNGLRSIHGHLGEAYGRVRLGIGHPGDKALVASYVLHDFAKADADWLDPLLDAIAEAAPILGGDDLDGFQAKVGALRQPRKTPASSRPRAPKTGPSKAEPTKARPSAAQRAEAQRDAPAAERPPSSPLQQLMDRFRK